jgi:hypothetical protein
MSTGAVRRRGKPGRPAKVAKTPGRGGARSRTAKRSESEEPDEPDSTAKPGRLTRAAPHLSAPSTAQAQDPLPSPAPAPALPTLTTAASGSTGRGGAQQWYACWPSNRALRDALEPLLLINSSAALVTLTPRQLSIQLVDRFYTSVFQRSFWAGVDYALAEADPLASPELTTNRAPPLNGEALFEECVDIGTLYEILSGTTPATMALLGLHHNKGGARGSAASTNAAAAGDRDADGGGGGRGDDVGDDDEDEDEDEDADGSVSDDGGGEGKRRRAKGAGGKRKGSADKASTAAGGPPRSTGRRAAVSAAATCAREERAVWRFTCPPPPRVTQGALDVKVRFVVLHSAKDPTAPADVAAASSLSAAPPNFASFESPLVQTNGARTAMDVEQAHATAAQPALGLRAANPAAAPPAAGAPAGAPAVFPSTGLAAGAAGAAPVFVARTSGWERVPAVGAAPGGVITPTLEFGPCFPPRYYRLSPDGGWMNPAFGARVSQRCASDLQDDFVNLVMFFETCEIAITDGDVQLLTRTKRGRKVYAIRSEQPYEFDATPLGEPLDPPNTPLSAPPSTHSHPPGRAAAFSDAQGSATAKRPGRRQAKAASALAAATPAPELPLLPMLPRRPTHNTPRFYVEYVRRFGIRGNLRYAFLLRSFRILHKLVGSSSRIEWILHANARQLPQPPPPTQQQQQQQPHAHDPKQALLSSENENCGPLLCAFYQGTLAAERLVGVLMCMRLPPTATFRRFQ